ncbi:pitrilysin family protein [Kaistia dalseonensis]|uniref:Zinc protease n=1 Tax=Kaistia dalseonensis TaxID=410840 RepID=A0ABU0HCF8_9HYPH|nr:pitrilysin family protein [Kaistia dalseonensis]MCX5497359.1 pitrilysin family protein [Kaistia dalseonensis]MDQ0439997.1 zinc protease [Kaistia dalseonensis]
MPLIVARLGLALLGLLLIVPASYAAKIEQVVSPGGIKAWLVEDHAVPVIALNFAFGGGAAQDPAGKPGVANMLSALLDEGAGNLDSEAFQARLDALSLSFNFDAGRDQFYGSVKTLAENRDEAFAMLALSLQSPRFDKEPVERIRAQIESRVKRSSTDPDTVAMLAMCASAYPNHPYGQPVDGTEASVAAISVDDLKAYRDRIFARDNLKIAIVGAIDAKTAGALIDKTFGPLAARAERTPVPDVAPKMANLDIDMPNPQTIIRFGGPGIPRHDPDFMTAYVVNHILGGGTFSSRLYEEVREKRGLAYTISSTLVPLESSSAFAGGTATRADRADETVGIIKSEVARLAKDGPTAEELAKAKSYLIGSYALRFDSSMKIARQILGIQIDGLPIDYVEKRNAIIANVTLDDARRVAKRFLANGTDMIVRVGPVPKSGPEEAVQAEATVPLVKHL